VIVKKENYIPFSRINTILAILFREINALGKVQGPVVSSVLGPSGMVVTPGKIGARPVIRRVGTLLWGDFQEKIPRSANFA
jgi:hypothetical protein